MIYLEMLCSVLNFMLEVETCFYQTMTKIAFVFPKYREYIPLYMDWPAKSFQMDVAQMVLDYVKSQEDIDN